MSRWFGDVVAWIRRLGGRSRGAPNWSLTQDQASSLVTKLLNSNDGSFLAANASAIGRAVSGYGPDSSKSNPECGARMVVNLSSAHVPAFCAAARMGDAQPYKNAYDMASLRPSAGGKSVGRSRTLVDQCLPLPSGVNPTQVYFGAAEMNGTGIRFYGDVCLVLKLHAVAGDTVILNRNSYDVLRSPVREVIEDHPADAHRGLRRWFLHSWSGSWQSDLGTMAATKALHLFSGRERRMTTGQISEALLNDEDYIEILKVGSFGTSHLQEARLSAATAAHDALVADRTVRGPTPRLESLIWAERRADAEAALRRAGVTVCIMTTSGRTKD